MRPTFDRRLWILLIIIIIQCLKLTNQQNTSSSRTRSQFSHSSPFFYERAEIAGANSKNMNGWKMASDDNKLNFLNIPTQVDSDLRSALHFPDKCANCSKTASILPHVLTSSISAAATAATTTSTPKQKQMLFKNLNSSSPIISYLALASKVIPAKLKEKSSTSEMDKQKLLLHAYLNEDADADAIAVTGGIEVSQEMRQPSSSPVFSQQKYQTLRKLRHPRTTRGANKFSISAQRGGDQSFSSSAGLSSSEEQQLLFANNRNILDTSSAASSAALMLERMLSNEREREGKGGEGSQNKQGDISVNEESIEKNKKSFSENSETNLASEAVIDGGSAIASPSSSNAISSISTSAFNFPNTAAELASSLPKSLLYSSQFSSQESESLSQEDLSRVFSSKIATTYIPPTVSNIDQRRRSNQNDNNLNGSNKATQNITTSIEKPNESYEYVATKSKATRSAVVHKKQSKPKEPIIIIDDFEEIDSGTGNDVTVVGNGVEDRNEDYSHDEPRALPLRPIIRGPYDENHDEEMSVVYAEQHTEIRLMCEVDLDVATSTWYKNGQIVHAMDRTARVTDYRFIKESNGGLTINNVMLEDDGKWQCEAENARAYVENARPVKLVILDRPKPPYLLIDSRRLDAGNIFVPVKENSELNLACICEGGNPKPTLSWEVLLSPGVDRHAQKLAAEVLELEEIKNDKDKFPYKINSGAKTEARLPAVYRAHHNARILCVMEHPTLKIRQNASLLLDVQYTPSFAISRTPGFGYPLREGIEVSLKCDVDSNPPSTPRWQKDDGETPVPQIGDGFLNFTSIRREHSGWYKCTSRHLNFQYSSIGYYLSVRYDSVDVTSEPDDQEISVAAASHNPNKGQLEVQLGGAVTLQCPQGSLGCWSHLDPVTARLRGLGQGLSTPTGQFSLKDVVYHDAGTYKCIGQSPINKKKLEVLQTVGVLVKGAPTVLARNSTPVAYPGSPLHLSVEFCANPPAHAARWLHGDRVFTPGNQYGSTVLAYGVTDLPTPFCKEARLTYVSMHERVPRTFYFIVSSPGGVAEAMIKVNFTMRYRTISNSVDDEEEELSEPEEIHFPVFGTGSSAAACPSMLNLRIQYRLPLLLLLLTNLLLCSCLTRTIAGVLLQRSLAPDIF